MPLPSVLPGAVFKCKDWVEKALCLEFQIHQIGCLVLGKLLKSSVPEFPYL